MASSKNKTASSAFVDMETSSNTSSDSEKVNLKSVSIPRTVKPQDVGIKTQISAPSYFHSLKENDLPPFLRPGKEERPKIAIDAIVTPIDVIKMVHAAESDPRIGLRKFLLQFLVEKDLTKNFALQEQNFLVNLLVETIDYAAQRSLCAYKLACLLTIYLSTHNYFKWHYWSSPNAIWLYFKEMMIRHTIEDSPCGQEVFEPEECYDIVTHFHTLYMCNLPLIHIVTFGAYRLKFNWPFKMKATEGKNAPKKGK